MPPYYPDQYRGGFSGQSYYPIYAPQQATEQPYGQYVHQQPQPRVQVNIPPSPHQNYPQPQPSLQYQHAPVQQPFNAIPVAPPQYYNQHSYVYNNQFQQQYQPPPPVRVIVPPSPIQYKQASQNSVPQISMQHQPTPSIPKMSQSDQSTPRPKPRVLQEQPNTARTPASSSQKSTPKATSVTTTVTAEQPPQQPSILLTLADEYIEAARKLEERTEDYHILMSTALRCLQVALKNFKLSPVRSAQVSLKYAQLLYDETDDLDDAELVLTKSIDLCERMKFTDFKYAMQLLLAKVLFRSKPRAAVRDLGSMIQDIETYKHTAWEYPFRLQAVFFLLASRNHHSIHDALQHLDKIQVAANLHADRAVYTFAAILESLLHLRNPGPDSLSHSQQALAKARSYQLNPDVEGHPQMSVMMEFIDLMWTLNTAADQNVLDKKRTNLKDALYASLDGKAWSKDESTWLRINSKSLKGVPTQVGGLIHDVDGRYYMALSWLGKKEFESLGFLLNGAALIPQNHYMQGKAEKFILEGYKITNDGIPAQESVLCVKDSKSTRRNHILSIYFLAELAFMRANKGSWDKTQQAMKLIESHIKMLGDDVPDELKALHAYLNGCIAQANGDLDTALKHFQSHHLVLHTPPAPNAMSKPQKPVTNSTLIDFQLLATINTAFIIRLPSHPQHGRLDRLLNLLTPHFPNTSIQAGSPSAKMTNTNPTSTHPLLAPTHSLLLATLPNTTILQTKSLLAAALQNARSVSNVQVMSLCLTLMYDRFFRGGIQDVQAVKCAQAASHHVRAKLGSPLWGVMTGILQAESMQLVGDDANVIREKREAVGQLWENVPEGVKRAVEEV